MIGVQMQMQKFQMQPNQTFDQTDFLNSATYLTHWGRDKMADIFQTTFSNVFSRMKMCELD